jgi:hypothetical protein
MQFAVSKEDVIKPYILVKINVDDETSLYFYFLEQDLTKEEHDLFYSYILPNEIGGISLITSGYSYEVSLENKIQRKYIIESISWYINKISTEQTGIFGDKDKKLLSIYDIYFYNFERFGNKDVLNILKTIYGNDVFITDILRNCILTTPIYSILAEYFKAYVKSVPYGGSDLYTIIDTNVTGEMKYLWENASWIRTDDFKVLNMKQALGLIDAEYFGIFQGALNYMVENK